MNRSRLALVPVVALLLGFLGVGAAAASTGPLDPGWVTSNGYDPGAATLAGMTSPRWADARDGVSSWTPSPYGSRPAMYWTSGDTTMKNPAAWLVSEPYYTGTTSSRPWWAIDIRLDWTKTNQPEGVYLRTTTYAYCSATATGVGEAGTSNAAEFYEATHWGNGPVTRTRDFSCPPERKFLQAINFKVEVRPDNVRDSPAIYYVNQWWSSGVERLGGRPTLPNADWCKIEDPGHEGVCLWVGSNTGGRGGSFGDESINAKAARFDIVCANPPAAEWLSFGWLPEWIGHYVNCLFVPRGGLSLDKVEDAMSASFVGEIERFGSGIAAVSMPATRCGVIADSDLNLGITTMQFRMDTCAEPWPKLSPIRTTLGVGLIILTVISSVYSLARVAGFNYGKAQP